MRLKLPNLSGRPVFKFITRFFVGVQGMLNLWDVFGFIDTLEEKIIIILGFQMIDELGQC